MNLTDITISDCLAELESANVDVKDDRSNSEFRKNVCLLTRMLYFFYKDAVAWDPNQVSDTLRDEIFAALELSAELIGSVDDTITSYVRQRKNDIKGLSQASIRNSIESGRIESLV